MTTASKFKALEDMGRIRLSENFFLREFLYSETAIAHSLVNVPDDLDTAVQAGKGLCENVLEPIQQRWGKIHIRSGYRSSEVNQIGNINKHNCASNAANHGAHIWDVRDSQEFIGATACLVIPVYLNYFEKTALFWLKTTSSEIKFEYKLAFLTKP